MRWNSSWQACVLTAACVCTRLDHGAGGLLSEKVARSVVAQVFSGLRYLNEQSPSIIHYDLKVRTQFSPPLHSFCSCAKDRDSTGN
jgi:hypothetical protein